MKDRKPTYQDLEEEIIRLKLELKIQDEMINAIPNPLFVKNKDFIYTNCNDAFADYLGLPKSKIINSTVYDISPKELADKYYAADCELRDRLKKQVYESEVKSADGTLRDISIHKARRVDKKNEFFGIVGNVFDISERKQAEEALKESEKRFKDLFENLVDEVHIWKLIKDKNDNIVNWELIDANSSALKSWGKTKKQVVGKKTNEIFNYDVQSYFMPIVKNIFDTGKPYNWETYFPPTNQYLAMTSIPMGDFFISTGRDVKEKKKAKEELIKAKEKAEESELTFRKLFEDSFDAILLIDHTGVFVECNQAALDILKMTREEFLFQPPTKISPEYQPNGQKSEEAAAEMINLAYKKGIHRFDWTHINAEGVEFIAEISLMPILLKGQTMLHTTWRDITERKLADKALIESMQKYREMANLLPQLLVEINLTGEITYVNHQSLTMFGYTEDEIIGKSSLIAHAPEERELIKENIKLKYAGHEFRTREFKMLRKDGSIFPALIFTGIIYKNNKPSGIRAIVVDISDQKRVEQELIATKEKAEESKEKFKLLSRLTSKMLLLQDVESIYKFIAEKLQKLYPNTIILNCSIDESTRQSRLEIISGLDNSLLKKASKISGFNPIGRTYKLTDIHNNYFKSGNFIEVGSDLAEFSASEVSTFTAKAIEKLIGLHKIYTIGINKDNELLAAIHFFTFNKNVITDGNFIEVFVKQAGLVLQKKINEKALTIAKEKAEESKKRFKRLLENAPDAVAINDKDGRLIYASPNAFRHFGYSENEIIGHFGYEFTHPEDLDIVFKALDTIVSNPDKKATVKYRFRKRNGEYRWIETTFTNLLNDETIEGFVLNYSDITEKKQVLEELVIAKEKAEESDRLKSAFLANMSHEIRTPMNGILGFTNLLKEPGLTGKDQQKFISIIEKSGNRMLNTVNDIIDISKIEAGQVDVILSKINLNKQLDELLEFFLPEAKKKKIQLSITSRVSDQHANCKSDKEKLNSMLTNFIKNAIKYTPAGSIEFGYTIKESDKQNELKFYVKDTGIGIPKERQNAIFNRFEQADIEDQQVFEGSGLGLAISKAYVEMLKGKIWVESEEEVGSQFYFTIPYEKDNKEISNQNTEGSNRQLSAKKGLKILIVEDDETAITYLSIVLKEYAKETLIAKTGTEALKMCRENLDINLVLMDIKIPGIDGYEATRQIREFNKNVFIIAQTAYAQSGDREHSIQAGCNDYISKPIDKKILLEIISNRF